MKKLWFLLFVVLVCTGCAAMKEDAKKIWGSSTEALEEGRPFAVRKTFSCEAADCFDAVLKFANADTDAVDPYVSSAFPVTTDPAVTPRAKKVKNLDVFSQDRKRNFIVVMGIPDHVNTTEAGIFFTPVDGGTLIEVSSLSTGAKIEVADMIFGDLAKNFKDLGL